MDASIINRPLRILSLDGDGIRGFSSLIILHDLMNRIKVKKKLSGTPPPYEWFDLLVGTGTRGLIVLMLGRLKMPVDEAIDAYRGLSDEVFGQEANSWLGGANPCQARLFI
jgi:patatin-like phospholipase/acyl hydrolase